MVFSTNTFHNKKTYFKAKQKNCESSKAKQICSIVKKFISKTSEHVYSKCATEAAF